MEKVRVDDSPLRLAAGLLIASLLAGVAANALLSPPRRADLEG